MNYTPLHCTVSDLRGISASQRKGFVTAWLDEHASVPGMAPVTVTPCAVECDYVAESKPVPLAELALTVGDVATDADEAIIAQEFERTVPNEADTKRILDDASYYDEV